MFRDLFSFYLTIILAAVFRMRNPSGDGQAFWQPIKEQFAPRDANMASWRRLKCFDRYEKLEKEQRAPEGPKAEGETEGERREREVKHFLYQLWNLQANEDPNPRRLMQIALNLGQFVGTATFAEWREYGFEIGMLNIFRYMTFSDIMKLEG